MRKIKFSNISLVFFSILVITIMYLSDTSYAQKPPSDYIYTDHQLITEEQYNREAKRFNIYTSGVIDKYSTWDRSGTKFQLINNKGEQYTRLALYVKLPEKAKNLREDCLNIILNADKGKGSGMQIDNGKSRYHKIIFTNMKSDIYYDFVFNFMFIQSGYYETIACMF